MHNIAYQISWKSAACQNEKMFHPFLVFICSLLLLLLLTDIADMFQLVLAPFHSICIDVYVYLYMCVGKPAVNKPEYN